MKGKKLLMALGVVCLALVVAAMPFMSACAPEEEVPPPPEEEQPTPPKPITLKYHHWAPPTHMDVVVAKEWADEITKRTDGQVKFEYFTGATLCGMKDQLDGLKSGLFEVGHFMASIAPGKTPLWTIEWQPWGLSTDAVIQGKVIAELAKLPVMEEELAKWKAQFLVPFPPGPRIVMSKKPCYTLDDFKGLKMRASGRAAEAFAMIGADIVSMPTRDAYESLQKGVIEAIEMPFTNLVSYGIPEVTDYFIPVNTSGGGCHLLIAIDVDLPEDIQKVIVEVSEEWIVRSAETRMQFHARDMKKVKEAGQLTFIDFPKSEQERFRELASMPVMEEWIKDMEAQGLPGREVFEAYRDAFEKYIKAAK